VFMDIEMPPYNSFQLLDSIPDPHFEVIFVTAYQEYALRAIKMAALDYILKPFKGSDIVAVINKLRTIKKNKLGELTGLIKNLFQQQHARQFFQNSSARKRWLRCSGHCKHHLHRSIRQLYQTKAHQQYFLRSLALLKRF